MGIKERGRRRLIVCDCGSKRWYYLHLPLLNDYQSRCDQCNALIDPFVDNRTDFLVRNERAGYVGTD